MSRIGKLPDQSVFGENVSFWVGKIVNADKNPTQRTLMSGGSWGFRYRVRLVSDYSNIQYDNVKYKYINDPGKSWIRKYTLALAKELLGTIRGKYSTISIPGADTTLDGDTLRGEATAEKEILITQLREDLEASSRRNSMARNKEEAEFQQELINKVPLNIYIG